MEHDDDGVTVLVEDLESGSIRALRTAYLVGCDGGRSWVRKRLGIEFVGDFAQGRNFAVHFRAPALMELLREHADGVAAQIQTLANESRPYITVVDGADEWRLSVYLDRDPSPRTQCGGCTQRSARKSTCRSCAHSPGVDTGWLPRDTATAGCSWPATPPTCCGPRGASERTPASVTRLTSVGSSPPSSRDGEARPS